MKARAAAVVLCGAALLYLGLFLYLQCGALGDPHALEWDARNMLLPAWRYHGSGLFPHDLTVDLMARFATPGWRAVYWVGTLFMTPPLLSRFLPFALLLIVAWQGWSFGKREGGPALGAATVILLVHCTMIWNRMAGGHARAFAYPLVVAFLRYAVAGAERRTLLVLVLAAVFYPSALVICGPAYALSLLWNRRRGPWLRFLAIATVALGLAAWQSRPDPRFGGAPTLAQAATLPQMGPGGAQPFYPLPKVTTDVGYAAALPFRDDGDFWHGPLARWSGAHHQILTIVLLLAALAGARRSLRQVPPILLCLGIATCALYFVARLLAYRLYIPDRVLVFGWPPLVLLGLPLLLSRASPRWAPALLIVFVFGVCGDGLARNENITWFASHDNATIQFVATLPKTAVIATHPERSVYVQTYAHRNVLFSATTNIPWFYSYAVEMQSRLQAFFTAYYADDLATLRAFATKYEVDYLIADERDFGPDARARADYYAPWGALCRELLTQNPHAALATPPSAAVVFHDGQRFVVDLHKL